jgi:hypothetical protein
MDLVHLILMGSVAPQGSFVFPLSYGSRLGFRLGIRPMLRPRLRNISNEPLKARPCVRYEFDFLSCAPLEK